MTAARALFLSALFVCPSIVFAQAWVPEKGEGTETFSFQHNFVKDHLGSGGERVDRGHIRSFVLFQDLEYGITDKLALDVSLPFVLSKYNGSRPHQLPVDNGNYHGNFQDVRFNLRYNLRARPLMITPFVGLGVPSNDYIYFAHSAAGTAQREYVVGSNFGHSFESVLSHPAYVQGLYAFLTPQEIMRIRTYRSRMDWDVGYFPIRRITLRAVGSLQIGHSGYQVGNLSTDLGDFPHRVPTDIKWRHHDQTSRISYLNVGGGANFQVTNSWSTFLLLTTTVWGRNGHALSLGEVFGVSWTFRTRWAKPRLVVQSPQRSEPATKAPVHVH